jgi:hypothetical protein
MTEAEWLACDDPEAILNYICRSESLRKLRLLACGLCRQNWDRFPHRTCQEAVETSERFAEGAATGHALSQAAWRAEGIIFAIDGKVAKYQQEQRAIQSGWLAPEDAIEDGYVINPSGRRVSYSDARRMAEVAERVAFGRAGALMRPCRELFDRIVIRDVFGNPFRPVAVDPHWLTSDVVALARGIYDERAFDRMPILADALQDAGCDSAAVLDHCRDPNGVHVRGCWVVDLLLGKS